jgi:CDP-diacylglycerol--serine O-phosphatidyltransferase
MVSRLPVYSGKQFGKRVAPEMVLPVFVVVVLFFAVLIAYPWPVLTVGTLAYLGSLPFGWMSYREHRRKSASPAQGATKSAPTPAPTAAADVQPEPRGPEEPAPDRPARLN